MAVAKSYQTLEVVKEPYEQSGRMYVQVKTKSGTVKQVRWYTDAEYAKMYPSEKPVVNPTSKTQRELLGFQNGFITIFKGDTYSHLEWFRNSIARYTRYWGWYIVSTEKIPEDLPEDLEPIRLNWNAVGQENGELLNETAIKEAVEALIYEPTSSEHVGEIGERLELYITVIKSIDLDNDYGHSTLHVMEDESGNVYVWTTASKTWPEGAEKHIRGTVKKHSVYHNVKQTILNRCFEIKQTERKKE